MCLPSYSRPSLHPTPQPPVWADLVPALVLAPAPSSPSHPTTSCRGRPCACPRTRTRALALLSIPPRNTPVGAGLVPAHSPYASPLPRLTKKTSLTAACSATILHLHTSEIDSPSGSNPTNCREVQPGIRVTETQLNCQTTPPLTAGFPTLFESPFALPGLPRLSFPFRKATLSLNATPRSTALYTSGQPHIGDPRRIHGFALQDSAISAVNAIIFLEAMSCSEDLTLNGFLQTKCNLRAWERQRSV